MQGKDHNIRFAGKRKQPGSARTVGGAVMKKHKEGI